LIIIVFNGLKLWDINRNLMKIMKRILLSRIH